ncbi:MAG: ATP-binding cassette domain-containing protein [Spirochaetes bacterium]|nr:ATP-binding cassette domain-containing protein [Spirochaetota bacterium]
MGKSMIELVNVKKKFDGKIVLNGVSFKVERGETFVIIGQSGTGKTVTLRHIAGLVDPDEGHVLIDGVRMDYADANTKTTLREKMGIVFQSGALINWMTVEENIALPLIESRKYSKNKIEEIVNYYLRILQLTDARNKMPAEISGGMKKRAALARVLVRNPEIILYDEPTAGLDPVMSRMIDELVRQMQRDFGVTSVVVTHEMQSAYYIADRIAMLYKGELIACDVPENIKSSKNPIVQQFITGSIEGPIEVQ